MIHACGPHLERVEFNMASNGSHHLRASKARFSLNPDINSSTSSEVYGVPSGPIVLHTNCPSAL